VFDPEDGGDRFLWNWMALYLRRYDFSIFISDLSFKYRWLWVFYFMICRRETWWKSIDVSEECTASVFGSKSKWSKQPATALTCKLIMIIFQWIETI
jgi:hypothetical protein